MDNVNQKIPPIPSKPEIKTSNNLKFYKTIAYGFVVVSIGVSIAIGGYLLGANKNKPQPVNSKVSVAPSVSPTPDPTADWQIYKNEKYGFWFKYPLDLWVNDFTVQGSTRKTVPPFVNFGADNIYTVGVADGVCGTTSPDVYQKQKLAFDKAKNGNNFDDGFSFTNRNVEFSKIIVNDFGAKFAYGISLCRGHVQEDDPGALFFIAVGFNGDTRVGFYLPTGNLLGEKVKDMERVAGQISGNNYKGEVQVIYNNFLKVLSTFKFTQ